MSSAPTRRRNLEGRALAGAGGRPARRPGAAGRDDARGLSRCEFPRRPDVRAAARSAHLAAVERGRGGDARGPRAADARWIFHIGHVGSTLIARLLGELDSVLSVREPRALRDLTFFPPEVSAQLRAALRALFSRTFAPDQTALRQSDQLRQRDRRGACTGGRARTVPVRHAAFVHRRHPRRREFAARSCAGWPRHEPQRLASRGSWPACAAQRSRSRGCCLGLRDDRLEAAPSMADGARLGRFRRGPRRSGEGLCGMSPTSSASPQPTSELAARSPAAPSTRRYSKATEYEYSAGASPRPARRSERPPPRATSKARLPCSTGRPKQSPLLRKALDRAQAES